MKIQNETIIVNGKEARNLSKNRMYLIFEPSSKNSDEFSVKLADTTIKKEDSTEDNKLLYVVMGLMSMVDSDLDFLIDKGQEVIYDLYLERKKQQFKNFENVIIFNPHERIH